MELFNDFFCDSHKPKPQKSSRSNTKAKKRKRRISSDGSSSDTVEYDVQSYGNLKQKKMKLVNRKTLEQDSFQGDWGIGIPPIVLLRIFKFVVDSVGPVPFLCR